MLPLIAIPVLHSSGMWIASTAASGYLAGTISGTWVGAFVLGNSGLLGSLGVVSAAGILGASGGLTTAVGSGLSAIGLGGVAVSLGLAPATFLGLTPVGWAIAGSAATIAALGYYLTRKSMQKINEERQKGGLEDTTIRGIIQEIRQFETDSLNEILSKLESERDDVMLTEADTNVEIDGRAFPIAGLNYVINKDGSEELVHLPKGARKETALVVKLPSEVDPQLSLLSQAANGREGVSLSDDDKTMVIHDNSYSLEQLKYVINNDCSEEILHAPKIGRKRRVLLVKPARKVNFSLERLDPREDERDEITGSFAILSKLLIEFEDVLVSDDGKSIEIHGWTLPLDTLKYVINKDGSEDLVHVQADAALRVKPPRAID